MKTKLLGLAFGVAAGVAFALAGCGGGGGGGGGGVTYTGNTALATVTATNARALSVEAVEGGRDATDIGVLAKGAEARPKHAVQLHAIAASVEATLARVLAKVAPAKTAAENVSGTEPGYSGTFSYSLGVNPSTGAFSGTITFNSYRDSGESPVMSGPVAVSGVVNTFTGDISTLTMTLSGLRVLDAAESTTLNGTLSMTFGASQVVTMSLVRTDDATGNMYWHRDFTTTITGNSMTMTGTYYHHQYGYVVVTTTSPLFASYAGAITGGEMLFAGSNGSRARLRYAPAGSTVEVDATGTNNWVVVQ